MDWKILAIFTPVLFVTYQSISKLLPKGAPIFLVNAVASLIGAIIMYALHRATHSAGVIDTKTFPLVIFIGILISFGNFLIIKAYSLGAPQGGFTSIFYPLLIVYGIIFGLIFWNEKLNMYQSLGIALSIIGIFLTVYFRK